MKSTLFFLHGLESSSQGRKGRWFQQRFPQMIIGDYRGSINERMKTLTRRCHPFDRLILIGSSFGGLMAVNYAIAHPEKCKKLILLAPALNFDGFVLPQEKCSIPTVLISGEHDSITPHSIVIPLAQRCLSNLETILYNDDHMLARTFPELDWSQLIGF